MLLLDKALTTTQQARAFVTACALRDPRCSLPWARETRVAVCVSLLHSEARPAYFFSNVSLALFLHCSPLPLHAVSAMPANTTPTQMKQDVLAMLKSKELRAREQGTPFFLAYPSLSSSRTLLSV
jgi:hypothetical protein